MNYAHGILLGLGLTAVLAGVYHLRAQRLDTELAVAQDCYERGLSARVAVKLFPPYTVCAPTDELTAARIRLLPVPAGFSWYANGREVLRRDTRGRWWANGRELKTDAEIGAVLREWSAEVVRRKPLP